MKFILREGFKKLKNYKKLTFATFLTSMISYLVLGMFLLITFILLENFSIFQESETKVVVFVDSKASTHELEAVAHKIQSLDGLNTSEYISNEEGLINLQKNFNEQEIINEFKEDNPIPHTYTLSFKNKNYADVAYNVIKTFDNIQDISYEKEYLNEISETLNKFKASLFIIVAGLLLSSAFLIVIVISLTIHNQRKNIKIMLLTGAPIKYIIYPFIVQGLIISTLSAGMSSAIIMHLCNEDLVVIEKIFPFITAINPEQYSSIPILIIGLGALIGLTGSFFASKSEMRKVTKTM